MQGIQKVVFDIIKTSKDMGLPYITNVAIKEEARNTSLIELDSVIVNTKRNIERKNKKTQLDFSIEQALHELKKKGLIKQRKHGHWTVDKSASKYKPVVCKAIEEQYEIYCQKCNKYTYQITDKKKISDKCQTCGKKVQISFYKYHCPVRNMFIGEPSKQCELIHGTNLATLSKQVFPMKICYFSSNPTKLSLEYAREKVKKEEEKRKNNIISDGRGY